MSEQEHGTDWFDPEATTFGDRLTGAREAAGLGQAELADRLGVKAKTIRAWEADQSAPRANRLSILCGLLNVSLVWLMTGHGDGSTLEGGSDQDGDILEELEALRRDSAIMSERLAALEARLRARFESGGETGA